MAAGVLFGHGAVVDANNSSALAPTHLVVPAAAAAAAGGSSSDAVRRAAAHVPWVHAGPLTITLARARGLLVHTRLRTGHGVR